MSCWKRCFILIFNFCICVAALSETDIKIQMITDLIGSSDKATSIVAQVCWKPFDLVHLMKSLMDKNNPKTFRFIDADWMKEEHSFRERIVLITDMNCPEAEEFLEKANAYNRFAFPYRWIVIGKPINESVDPTSEFSHLQLFIDSEVIYAQRNETDSYILTMNYKLTINGTWEMEVLGNWTQKHGIEKSSLAKSSISIRRKNLKGHVIKTPMVVLDNTTRINPYDLRNVFSDTVTKSSIRTVDPIYVYLNATKYLMYSDTWGYYRNGTFGGMIAELTVGDAELAGNVLFATQDRMEVLDYLSCPTPLSIQFVFREPPLSYQNNLYLLPFKTTVWYCLGAFVLVLTLILYINALWESRKMQNESIEMDPTAIKPNLSDIAILVICAISQQGSPVEFKGILGRIVIFLLFLAFLLLYSAYSASIVALLQSSSNQIRTLSDLVNSKLELGVEDLPYNRYFFETATEPVRKALYETKIAPKGTKPRFMSLEEGVKKLQNEPFAFNMNSGIGYRLVERYFHEHEKCGLHEIAYFYSTKTYTTCRKESPFREVFKVGLFKIIEYGLSDRENRLIYSRKPSCQSRGGSFGSVNMVDFHPVLLMYLYGIILSFLFLFLEIVVHRKRIFERFDRNNIVI